MKKILTVFQQTRQQNGQRPNKGAEVEYVAWTHKLSGRMTQFCKLFLPSKEE